MGGVLTLQKKQVSFLTDDYIETIRLEPDSVCSVPQVVFESLLRRSPRMVYVLVRLDTPTISSVSAANVTV